MVSSVSSTPKPTGGDSMSTVEKMITNKNRYDEVKQKIEQLERRLSKDQEFDKLSKDYEINLRRKLNRFVTDTKNNNEFAVVNKEKSSLTDKNRSG
jgi:hypothetical protein